MHIYNIVGNLLERLKINAEMVMTKTSWCMGKKHNDLGFHINIVTNLEPYLLVIYAINHDID